MLTLNKIRRHREDDMSYIEHLIKKGADINKMYRGWNAVLQALDNGDMQILRLLATMGSPDLTARDEHGRSVYVLSSDFYLRQSLTFSQGRNDARKRPGGRNFDTVGRRSQKSQNQRRFRSVS